LRNPGAVQCSFMLLQQAERAAAERLAQAEAEEAAAAAAEADARTKAEALKAAARRAEAAAAAQQAADDADSKARGEAVAQADAEASMEEVVAVFMNVRSLPPSQPHRAECLERCKEKIKAAAAARGGELKTWMGDGAVLTFTDTAGDLKEEISAGGAVSLGGDRACACSLDLLSEVEGMNLSLRERGLIGARDSKDADLAISVGMHVGKQPSR